VRGELPREKYRGAQTANIVCVHRPSNTATTPAIAHKYSNVTMSVPYIYELVVDFLLADGRILKPR
jgi:hypothetical protein